MASRYTLEYLGLKKRNFNKYANMLKLATRKRMVMFGMKKLKYQLIRMEKNGQFQKNLTVMEKLF